MRLSELSTDSAYSVLCVLAARLDNFMQDEELVQFVKRDINDERAKTRAGQVQIALEILPKLTPLLLEKHREDFFAILGAVNEKTVAQIGKQSLLVTMAQIRDLVADEDFINFFKSPAGTEGSR